MADTPNHAVDTEPSEPDRRSLLSKASSVVMAGGLLAGYGTLAVMAGQFLYPSRPRKMTWVYVADLNQIAPGEALPCRIPNGQSVTITRRGESGNAEDFLALSSVCPHLGCQVRWEPHNNRFFCPCHNGEFDPQGKATAGPPKDAGQSLAHYALRVERGLLFIQVPLDGPEGSA